MVPDNNSHTYIYIDDPRIKANGIEVSLNFYIGMILCLTKTWLCYVKGKRYLSVFSNGKVISKRTKTLWVKKEDQLQTVALFTLA